MDGPHPKGYPILSVQYEGAVSNFWQLWAGWGVTQCPLSGVKRT
jgi:hypothetical protein